MTTELARLFDPLRWEVPKYPRCERCGHDASPHTTTKCTQRIDTDGTFAGRKEQCDCPGWKRDEGWPPPMVVGR